MNVFFHVLLKFVIPAQAGIQHTRLRGNDGFRKKHTGSYNTLIFILLAVQLIPAKTALDYYHSGAAMYIEGLSQQAKIEIEEGIRKYPNDEKLNSLAAQLKDLENKQQEQSQQNQGEGQENPDEENKDQDSQDEQDQQAAEQDTTKQNEGQADEAKDKQDSANSSLSEPPLKEGEMSEEEAKRLLDAYKNDEKEEQKNLKKRRGKKGRPAQDW